MPSTGLSVLGIVAIAACATALVMLPARFSWPRRVRWCVAMQGVAAADPSCGAARLDLREVRLAQLDLLGDRLVVAVHEVGRPAGELIRLVSPPPPSDEVALLRDWRDLSTPMLLHEARDGGVDLVGPVPTALGVFRRLTAVP